MASRFPFNLELSAYVHVPSSACPSRQLPLGRGFEKKALWVLGRRSVCDIRAFTIFYSSV